MSGGIVQLVATGAQDAWLSGKPEVSFFRSNYKRYTHYAHSVERQVIQGNPQAGNISLVRFEKKGDLLSYVYFTARDSNNAGVSGLDWSKVIDKVELMIGGQVIDTQDFQWMADVEPVVGAQNFSQRYLNFNTSGVTNQKNSFFPLKFFFCKDYFLALPLVAIQFHDVELRITWASQLGSTLTFGPTTNPALSAVPQATINVASAVVTGAGANTAFLSYNSVNGPLFTGSLVTTSPTPDANTLAIVKTIGNATIYSNVTLSFANTATIANVLPAANATLNVFAPVTTALVTANTAIGGTSTSATLTINSVNSPTSGTGIQAGQYVAGLPLTGPVVVTASNATTVNVSFGVQASPPAGASTLAGTQLGFFTGTATTTTTYASLTFACWANFIYLDQAERKFFADNTHDMLIHQVQRVPMSSNPVQELALAHPVKFIAFQSQRYDTVIQNGNNALAASNYMLKTQINGVDVGEFRHLNMWVDAPQYYNTPFGYVHNNLVANVAVISYCLDTSKNQPTGTINFSRLDTYRIVTPVQLSDPVTGRTGPLALASPLITNPYLYAVNYNVLRIQNGLASLLYAN
jgi:hypothetical protein